MENSSQSFDPNNSDPPQLESQQVVNSPTQTINGQVVSSAASQPNITPIIEQKITGGWKAITALILGIISIILCFFALFSIPVAIIGIVLGILGLKSNKKGLSIAGIILSSIGLAISILLIILFSTLILFGSSKLGELSKNPPTISSSDSSAKMTDYTNQDQSIYTDAADGFSFNPGASMQKATYPFLYAGNPFTGSGYTLISKTTITGGSSNSSSIKAALQSAKAKGYSGTDPNPVTLTKGSFTSYVINYTFASATGEKNEMWQMAFYVPNKSKIVVINITSPYLDAANSKKILDYAYTVFESVQL